MELEVSLCCKIMSKEMALGQEQCLGECPVVEMLSPPCHKVFRAAWVNKEQEEAQFRGECR